MCDANLESMNKLTSILKYQKRNVLKESYFSLEYLSGQRDVKRQEYIKMPQRFSSYLKSFKFITWR